ncbi:OFA family MFS transporter [Candidatus Sumerlaeota bacterium]|nr:OFA family MFS transporter [Candidatus Sumerlaeota bacterium]
MSNAAEEQKTMNRWIVVVGAILIQLCLGAIYAWSVFTVDLKTAVEKGGYGFTAAQTQWIFSIGLATFAVVMVMAGKWQAKIGPRPVAMLGGIVLGAGYILGGFLGGSFIMQFLCIGILGGAGIGLAYVVPIAVCVKWFPDKKGMITGFAVAGFGFGATLWVKLAGSWGDLLNTHLFGLPGVQSVFIIYGIVFLVCVLLGSIVMVNPPQGYKPAGWNPPAPKAGAAASGSIEMNDRQMLATLQFYELFAIFACSAMAGLMVIGCIKLFGVDALVASGAFSNVEEAGFKAGTAMALYAILNGLGRIAWGTISDKLGRKLSIAAMCLFQGVMMLLFFKLGATPIGLILCACIIGFNFGGNFALFPAATADYFGNKNVGTNYGWVFLAYGVAGIIGPQIAGYYKDAANMTKLIEEYGKEVVLAKASELTVPPVAPGDDVSYWLTPFMIAGIACIFAGVLALTLRQPVVQEAESTADGASTASSS